MRIFMAICLFLVCSIGKAQLTVTGTLEATSFTGTGLTINGDIKGYTLVLTGTLTAASFSGTYTGTILTPNQSNITALGVLSNLSVSGQVEVGNISTTSITGVSGLLRLRETGGEYGEAGLLIYNKTGSNGPVFYTNPTSNAIDLVDFGFLSLASNSQTNLRFEHRSASWLDPLNTNGEMQFFHITNNNAAAIPSTSFAAFGSSVMVVNSTSAVKLNGGTGASTFSTSGVGTLVLGGTASTGAITVGESSATQTVNVGTGTGASTVNIATGGTSANAINIGNAVGATALNISTGTGASTFATTGAGTLVIGGAASTGAITLGQSSNTQTVNVGTGAGASTVNIATGATTANAINIGNTTGTTAVNINTGTGASTFATTGAGTLVLGGAASTGALTFGSSSGTQTVNIGTGAGVSLINIGTGSSDPEVTIGKASVIAGAGLRLGNGRFTINKPTAPTISLNAATTLTITQLLEAGIIGFASTTTRILTLPTAAGASGIVQNLPGTPQIGDVFSFVVFNTSAGTITLAGGTGATIVGPPAIFPTASAASRTFYCRVTSVTANSETISCY